MSTADSIVVEREAYLQYRAVSMVAVCALIIGIISIPALFFDKLLVLPLIGTVLGLNAWWRVARRPDELTGKNLAILGTSMSVVILIAGSAFAAYEYATELPPGFARLEFDALKPDANFPQLPIPPSALNWDGKKVFVKGYVHPGVDRREGIKQFVLVPDMKTCCFGGQPALTDMIEVTLKDPLRINYSFSRRKLAGVLRVSPQKKAVSGLDGVYYRLDAEIVK